MAQRNDRTALALAVMDLIDEGHRQISRRLDLTRVRILALVGVRGPIRPSVIAADLGLTASSTSRHLAALEQAGQIEFEADPDDNRTFLARITASGRADSVATVEAGTAAFATVIADWPDEDVVAARELIERLNTTWAERRRTDIPLTRPGAGPRWRRTMQGQS
ncbi:MarR family transcriptional regulator [Kribbella antibiotica]|uniref:MarR family transcriptional regulator n=1 Tax=Kribbella antibiotica TaxID=190195 RepID=A0A4R4ZVV1_9ACTN|nr:MarR family transcriptional regulator [Kribbella antibiotica]TDD62496.1 MarR family transcriptional regulator [Kribbella antibiotica]